MVFVRDSGGVFDAPLERVWAFVGSGDRHADAHEHQATRRVRHSPMSGTYSWEQPFDGRPTRFTMTWTTYWPAGLAYTVDEGPFAGSKFFLVYEPMGDRTGVEVVGEFVSPTLPEDRIASEVLGFFAKEFEQDSRGLARFEPTRPG